tara:strand:+ start:2186 stop:3427 length:1242 start_codon:yes stop_codon:yes gene_type:complete
VSKKFIIFYLLLLIISLGISIYLFELYLIINSQKKIAQVETYEVIKKIKYENSLIEKESDKYSIPLSTCDFLTNNKLQPHQAYSKKLNIYPLTNPRNYKVIAQTEGEEWAKYKTDRYGFRNIDTVWNKENSNYFFGDSYAISSHVSEENSIHFLLNAKGYDTLSLSGGCWSPPEYYAVKKEMLFALKNNLIPKPKTLNLLYYIGNDFSHPITWSNQNILKKYFTDPDFVQRVFLNEYQNNINNLAEFTKKNISIKKPRNKVIRYLFSPFKLNHTKHVIKRFVFKSEVALNAYGQFVDEKNPSFNKIKYYINKDFEISKEICRIYKCKINVFALASYGDFFFKTGNKQRPGFIFEKYLKNLSINNNFNFISIYNEFSPYISKTSKSEYYFPKNKIGHYSIYGYSKLVDLMVKNF